MLLMSEYSDLIGIGLAGGQGVRARPLTLKAPGYLRSKAAMSFLGRRLIRWAIQILSSEGIKDYYVSPTARRTATRSRS